MLRSSSSEDDDYDNAPPPPRKSASSVTAPTSVTHPRNHPNQYHSGAPPAGGNLTAQRSAPPPGSNYYYPSHSHQDYASSALPNDASHGRNMNTAAYDSRDLNRQGSTVSYKSVASTASPHFGRHAIAKQDGSGGKHPYYENSGPQYAAGAYNANEQQYASAGGGTGKYSTTSVPSSRNMQSQESYNSNRSSTSVVAPGSNDPRYAPSNTHYERSSQLDQQSISEASGDNVSLLTPSSSSFQNQMPQHHSSRQPAASNNRGGGVHPHSNTLPTYKGNGVSHAHRPDDSASLHSNDMYEVSRGQHAHTNLSDRQYYSEDMDDGDQNLSTEQDGEVTLAEGADETHGHSHHGGSHHHHHHHHQKTSSVGSNEGGGSIRANSPPPAAASQLTSEEEKLLKEEEDRKMRIQIYICVSRCVAYPFYTKYSNESVRRYLKISKAQYQTIKDNFQAFLNGETSIASDEAFTNSVQNYYEVFLRSDRVATMVRSGGCSMHDFREVFRINIQKRIQNLPDIDGLSKETVLTSWLGKFDQICCGSANTSSSSSNNVPDSRRPSNFQRLQVPQAEPVMGREQLYDMFQTILGVKKYEHQVLFNACQLDNADEQAAQVRRELDGRLQRVEEMNRSRKFPKMGVKGMENFYIEEQRKLISELMVQLESVPVAKGSGFGGGGGSGGGGLQRFKKHSRQQQGSSNSLQKSSSEDQNMHKLEMKLEFNMEVLVIQLKNLKHLPGNKVIFCSIELKNNKKLMTDQAEVSKPIWNTQADFRTNQPLPTLKIKLFTESSSFLSLDNKELGRLELRPTCTSSKTAEWHKIQMSKGITDDVRIQISVKMEKPTNLKYCSYCYALGRNVFRKWRKRYLCLIQVSQYTFAMASYREGKAEPLEIMQLDGFTIDYCDPYPDLAQEGGKYFFNVVKEGDTVVFATEDEQERQLWVQAIYRATGQSYKPVPPTQTTAKVSNTATVAATKSQGENERARRLGLDEFIAKDPCDLTHDLMFVKLQSLTLAHRLADPYVSLGWFSSAQVFVLDEYCARYGVRGCERHVAYISDLLDRAENGQMVDPTLMHFSYAFCAEHVSGGTQENDTRAVLQREREKFFEVKSRLLALLEKQITEFRYCFPFGRPEGALKKTLGLLERVLMKDVGVPASADEVRSVIKKCLEQAALVNYSRISEYASIEARENTGCKTKKLEDIIHLAELCIEVLQQNEEHHAEQFKAAFAWFSDLLVEHAEIFWSLFSVDMMAVLEAQAADNWESFPLFQVLNDYLRNDANLSNGRFHSQLREIFAPQVVRYVDLMESSISQSIQKGFDKERWAGPTVSNSGTAGGVQGIRLVNPPGSPNNVQQPQTGCVTADDLLWKLEALQNFIHELHWPDEVFAEHLDNRLKLMAADMLEAVASKTLQSFETWLKKGSKSADFILPSECCIMINTILDMKPRVFKLCTMNTGANMHQYHNHTDSHLERVQLQMSHLLVEKMSEVLENTLSKLARYDEKKLLSSLLSLAKPVDELGKNYVEFMLGNLEQMRQKVNDELYILSVFETWYGAQVKLIYDWLQERKDVPLHSYQAACLSTILKKMHSDFELQGANEEVLDTIIYKTVARRIETEEATHAITKEQHSSSKTSLISSSPKSLLGSISSNITGRVSGLSSFTNFSNGFPTPSFLSK